MKKLLQKQTESLRGLIKNLGVKVTASDVMAMRRPISSVLESRLQAQNSTHSASVQNQSFQGEPKSEPGT